MTKEWYIRINGRVEGPFDVEDLRNDKRITPETLVWKQGFAEWVPIGTVKELKDVFKDKPSPDKESFDVKDMPARITPDGLIIDMRRDPPSSLFWILVVILLILYLLRLNWFS